MAYGFFFPFPHFCVSLPTSRGEIAPSFSPRRLLFTQPHLSHLPRGPFAFMQPVTPKSEAENALQLAMTKSLLLGFFTVPFMWSVFFPATTGFSKFENRFLNSIGMSPLLFSRINRLISDPSCRRYMTQSAMHPLPGPAAIKRLLIGCKSLKPECNRSFFFGPPPFFPMVLSNFASSAPCRLPFLSSPPSSANLLENQNLSAPGSFFSEGALFSPFFPIPSRRMAPDEKDTRRKIPPCRDGAVPSLPPFFFR